MSKETYVRCDRCGQLIAGSRELANRDGMFTRAGWTDDEAIDLCGPCADEVQKFIAKGVPDGEHR